MAMNGDCTERARYFLAELSPWEVRMLRMVCVTNLSYAQIAGKTKRTKGAVTVAAWRMYQKAEIHSRSEMILFALQNGLFTADQIELPENPK